MQRVVRGRYFLILQYKTDVVCSCFVLFLSMIVLFFSLPFVVVVVVVVVCLFCFFFEVLFVVILGMVWG